MTAKKMTVAGIAREVREFRAEMGEFKSEMGEFKSEMGEFKSEMGEFKSEMGKFKSETHAEFRNIREEIRLGDQQTRTHMTMLIEGLRDDLRIFMEAHLDLERSVRRLEPRR